MDHSDPRDQLAKIAMTCAILDSFWARERSTINSNRLEGVCFLCTSGTMRFHEDLHIIRESFPKKDIWDMWLTCAMSGRSLDSGRNSKTIHRFETVQKMRSHFLNFVHTCPDGMGTVFVGAGGQGSTISF